MFQELILRVWASESDSLGCGLGLSILYSFVICLVEGYHRYETRKWALLHPVGLAICPLLPGHHVHLRERGQWEHGGSSPHPTTSPGVDQLPPPPWALCSIRGDLRSHKNTTPQASYMSQGPSKEESGTFCSLQDKRVDFHPGGFSVYSMKTACNKGMGPTSGVQNPQRKE